MYPCFSTRFTGRYLIWYWYVTMVTILCMSPINILQKHGSGLHFLHLVKCIHLAWIYCLFFITEVTKLRKKKFCNIIISNLCTQFMIYLNLLFSFLKLKDRKSTNLKTLGQKYINFCKVILSFLNYYLLVKKRFNLNSMYVYIHLHLHFFICFLFQS